MIFHRKSMMQQPVFRLGPSINDVGSFFWFYDPPPLEIIHSITNDNHANRTRMAVQFSRQILHGSQNFFLFSYMLFFYFITQYTINPTNVFKCKMVVADWLGAWVPLNCVLADRHGILAVAGRSRGVQNV